MVQRSGRVGLGWSLLIGAVFGCSSSEHDEIGRAVQAVGGENLKASVKITSLWQNGYCADVSITNSGTAPASTWTVILEMNSAKLRNSWNGTFVSSGTRQTVSPVGWNASVPVSGTQGFGYCADFQQGSTSYAPSVVSPLGGPQGTGGASSTGGTSSTGGAATGGAATGGAATGGAATGGAATGGAPETGGAATGGAATGGAATGGAPETGGAATGGAATGGAPETGGAATGGAATGGAATGGAATGGAATGGYSGYLPTNDYLINPDHAIETIRSLADFRAKARDTVNGGFFTFVNRDGKVGSDRRKGFVNATRDAWTFSRTFMVTGDEKYLELASAALNFLYKYGWDNTNGGWYFTADEYGKLTPYVGGWDPNTWKWSFVQHYALLGIGAYCDVTRDSAACNWFQKGRGYLDAKMWDSRSAQLGYYDQTNLNWSNPTNKGFTPTVDALTTNAIQGALIWPDAYQQRMVETANIVVDRLVSAMDFGNVKLGFPENYNSNWAVSTSQTGADIGHVLKSAWVLARVYQRNPDARYRTAARKLIYNILNKGGWDESRGVPYTRYDWSNGSTTKQAECWQIEQAVLGGLSNWYIAENQTDKDTFLRMSDRALQFFSDNVIDHTYGGTWKLNNLDGSPADSKSNFYNVEYHSTEMFYFTYMYGNLMLHRTPVALYYKIPAATASQVVQLNPVAIDDGSLQIKSVTLDGAPLTTFTAASRQVTLAPGQGGKLRVVFGPA